MRTISIQNTSVIINYTNPKINKTAPTTQAVVRAVSLFILTIKYDLSRGVPTILMKAHKFNETP